MLRVINYHYNKGPIKVEFFKCKTIHGRFLHIAVLRSISLWWVINTILIYIIARYTWRGTFADIVHWPTTIFLFLLCFILNCHGTFLFSQIPNLFFCGISEQFFFAAVKEIHKLWFWSTTTSADTIFLIPKPSYHWNKEDYWGSADLSEVDLESDINFLASGNLRKYTSVPSQCEQ